MSEFVIDVYGKYLNWDIISANTLEEDVDDQTINHYAASLIESKHELMFSTEIDEVKYVPGSDIRFF